MTPPPPPPPGHEDEASLAKTRADLARSSIREGAALIVVASVLIASVVYWLYRSSPNRPTPLRIVMGRAASEPSGPYAGSRACAECHPGPYAAHSRSGHARTIRAAATSSVAKRLDGVTREDPEQPGVTWSYALRDGKFQATRSVEGSAAAERFVLDVMLGSGHHAGTFLSLTDLERPDAIEHRLTYYTETDSLEITPGQTLDDRAPGTTDKGRELGPMNTLKCLGCHTTPAGEASGTLPGRAPIPGVGVLNAGVNCERCHGPAREHVKKARQGREDLSLPFGYDNATAAAELGLCGQCHRHPSRFPRDEIRADDPDLTRFQPIGLMQSKCFNATPGGIRCSTCHDPHFRSSTDQDSYISTCLVCHDPDAGESSTPCPVSPGEDCLTCHMPRRDAGQRILFTDHWIRVPDPASAAKANPHP